MSEEPKKSTRGFASMTPERRREIASMGGKSVAREKRVFVTNHALAAAVASKGGKSVPAEKRAFSRNHALAVEAGSKGGRASHQARAAAIERTRAQVVRETGEMLDRFAGGDPGRHDGKR